MRMLFNEAHSFWFCVTEERLTFAIANMVGILVFVKLS